MNYRKFVNKSVRTKWLKDWTAEFLEGLTKVSERDEIKSYCESKKQELEEIVKERSKNPNGWMNTTANYMSQIRAAIKQWQETIDIDESNGYPQAVKGQEVYQHLSLMVMNYSSDFHRQRMEPTQNRKQSQRRNLKPIKQIDDYLDAIDGLLESREWSHLAVGLIAATGRRPSEILKTAQFEIVGKFEVMFSGQLKAKGQKEAYKIFTLTEASKVIDSLARLRRFAKIKSLSRKTLAEVDSGRNSPTNETLRETLAPILEPPYGEKQLSAKNLRAAYAAIAIYLFCPPQQSQNLFITEHMGHASDVPATNYEDYQVCDRRGNPLIRGAWLKRLDEEPDEPKMATVKMYRLRITQGDREILDDDEFLPGADLASRMSELVRLARLGKVIESGEVGKIVPSISPAPPASSVSNKEVALVPTSENLPNDKLFGSHSPNSGSEKMRRAVAAIKEYNRAQYSPSTMWAINISVLKQLSGCNSQVVRRYLDSDEGRLQVADYNALMGFAFHHNRGREKPITEFIQLSARSRV